MNKILVIGSVAFDSLETPFGKTKKTLGGSASYFSLASRFFAPTEIVAVVGKDFDKMNVLKKRNIETSGILKTAGKTFHWSGKYSKDLTSRKTLKTELGVLANFNPIISPAQQKSQYIFLGNAHPKSQLDVLAQISNPKFVGLDTMNYWIESALPDLKNILWQVNIFIINDEEAAQLTKDRDLRRAAGKILKMMPLNAILITKLGERGLIMFQKNKTFTLPAFPVKKSIDPTGAGDTFAGGFFGYLAKTEDISWNNLKKLAHMVL